jgi:cell division protein FtsB
MSTEIFSIIFTFLGIIAVGSFKLIEVQMQQVKQAHKKVKKEDDMEKAISHIPEIAEKTFMSYDMLNKHINSRQTKLRHDIDDIKNNQVILNKGLSNLNDKYNVIEGKIDTVIKIVKN